MSTTPPPGWYPDPADQSMIRYWDGSVWTQHVTTAGPAPAPPQTQSGQYLGYEVAAAGGSSSSGLRDVGGFLSATFMAFTRRIAPILAIAVAITVIGGGAILGAFNALGVQDFFDSIIITDNGTIVAEGLGETVDFFSTPVEQNSDIDVEIDDAKVGAIIAFSVLLAALYSIGAAFLMTAMVLQLDAGYDDRPMTIGATVAGSVKRLPRLIVAALAGIAVFLGGFLILGLVIAATGGLGAILVLVLIPGLIYVAVRLTTLFPAIVLTPKGRPIVSRAWEQTSGHFWGLFGRFVLLGLLVGIGGAIITQVFALLPTDGLVLALAFGLLNTVVNLLTTAVQVGAYTVVYRDFGGESEFSTGERGPGALAAPGQPAAGGYGPYGGPA